MTARKSHVSSTVFNAARSSNVASESASVSAIERQFTVEGWTLGTLAEDSEHEPRIQDVELGTRLKLKDPRQIRKLIKGLASAGIISPFAVMHAAEITGGRPAREFWLTEEEALLVATRSDAEGALAITREMIRVFMLARRGLLSQQSNDSLTRACLAQIAEVNRSLAQVTVTLANLSTALVANTQRIEALELRSTATTQGRISAVDCGRMLEAFRDIATLHTGGYTKGDKEQSRRWSKARLLADHKTRAAARHPMGRAWHTLDPRDLNAAWQRIDELREEARAVAAKREVERARGATLFS
jgi:hypothetical protein